MGRKKILFIDDEPDYIDSVRMHLERDYDVIPAFSAQEGWEKLEREKPDLIILDAMMPEKDGFALAKEIKEHPAYSDIPLIMLTAVVPNIPYTKYSPDKILRYEGDEFIEKSAPLEELLSTVKEYLAPSG
jgi:DNA-binding response OmpR family regulator